jgi:uncharacterized membrane protein YhaH (DUF805 family)
VGVAKARTLGVDPLPSPPPKGGRERTFCAANTQNLIRVHDDQSPDRDISRPEVVMDWLWFLFSFEGRINRAKFYLAGLVLLCWMIFLVFLFVVVSAAYGDFRSFGLNTGLVSLHATLDGPRSFHLDINDIFALVDPATYRALPRTDITAALAHAVVTPLFLWIFLAVSVKRLHDRDKSGWWMVLFFAVPGIYKQFEDRLPDTYFLLPVTTAVFALTVWAFVELYFLKGTSWPNRFGPNPLGKQQARPRSAASRLRATTAYD